MQPKTNYVMHIKSGVLFVIVFIMYNSFQKTAIARSFGLAVDNRVGNLQSVDISRPGL